MNKKLTKFEYARIVGARAAQIACGAFILIEDIPEWHPTVNLEIAEKELEQGKIPYNIVYYRNN